MCETEKGLALSRRFYRVCGAPLLADRVPDLMERMAIGLVGEGSECFGFDDSISRDHDWGPAFCLWLPEVELHRCAERLESVLADLPETFAGCRSRMSPARRGDRVGPMSIEQFYARFTNLPRPPESWQEWRVIPEHFLAVATNGEVFFDPLGAFTAFRQALLGFYPEDVRLKKMAARCALMAQSGQYNLPRMLRRGDRVAALLCMAEFSRQALSLTFLLNKKYIPFYKWAFHSVSRLPVLGREISHGLSRLTGQPWNLSNMASSVRDDMDVSQHVIDTVEEISSLFAACLRREGLSDGQSDWLLEHAPSIQSRISVPELREMPLFLE